MNKNSYLCRYMSEHPNWREELQKYPYFLKVTGYDLKDKVCEDSSCVENKDRNLVTIRYNMLASEVVNGEVCQCDFTLPEQKEARGIIIDQTTFEVVCWPFNKFGNYGESYADVIDWNSARVQEKVDGSIVKLFVNPYTGNWQLASNNIIDAKDSVFGNSLEAKGVTAGRLFQMAAEKQGLDISKLNPEYTYIFELVSPENRVVIKYAEAAIWHIGTRHNKTGQEINQDIGIQKPKEFALNNLEECLQAVKQLNKDSEQVEAEGFVVVDKNWKRVKIKTEEYVKKAHDLNNGVLTPKKCVELIRKGKGEVTEYLNYYPEKKKVIELYEQGMENLKQEIKELQGVYMGLWIEMCPSYPVDRLRIKGKAKELNKQTEILHEMKEHRTSVIQGLNESLRKEYITMDEKEIAQLFNSTRKGEKYINLDKEIAEQQRFVKNLSNEYKTMFLEMFPEFIFYKRKYFPVLREKAKWVEDFIIKMKSSEEIIADLSTGDILKLTGLNKKDREGMIN